MAIFLRAVTGGGLSDDLRGSARFQPRGAIDLFLATGEFILKGRAGLRIGADKPAGWNRLGLTHRR